jgi:hypothetical protein
MFSIIVFEKLENSKCIDEKIMNIPDTARKSSILVMSSTASVRMCM